MHLYFDESGDYAFPAERFDAYVQAALICPDSLLAELEKFVVTRREAWDVAELHATELAPEQLVEIATFIGRSDMQLLAGVTDSVLVTREGIAKYRLKQVATTRRNLDWYRRESTKGRAAPDQRSGTAICSGFVCDALTRAGYIWPRPPISMMPADLARYFDVRTEPSTPAD